VPPIRNTRKRRIALLAAGVIATGTTGNSLLRVGLSRVGPLLGSSPVAYLEALIRPAVVGGVLSLIACFLLQLTLLSWADLTFALPMTSPSYVVITIIGVLGLGEHVSAAHWFGVLLILCGVILVGRTKPLTPGSGIK
jgi:drug/metabolite transporter (DMT)-like permease